MSLGRVRKYLLGGATFPSSFPLLLPVLCTILCSSSGHPVPCDHPLYLTNAFWQHPFGKILNIPIWRQIQVRRRKRKRKLCGGAPPACTRPELAPFHLGRITGPLAQLEVGERTCLSHVSTSMQAHHTVLCGSPRSWVVALPIQGPPCLQTPLSAPRKVGILVFSISYNSSHSSL